MNRTKIEYADYSWSPLKMRCEPISAGCAHCWHLRFAHRHAANPTFNEAARQAYRGGDPFLDQYELDAPMRLHKPAKIAVQFMGDLWHHSVSDDFLHRIFNVMFLASASNHNGHTFMLLTKRSRRMMEWSRKWLDSTGAALALYCPRIWWGATVEGACEIERLRLLRATPAALRWVSFEPLISPVVVDDWDGISWAAVGAETGPKKRPCDPAWINSLRFQCAAAGVQFFGKVDQDGQPIIPREYPEST